MRKYTTEHTVYKFDELANGSKQKAIEKFREYNGEDSFWHECIIEEWTQVLEKIGFDQKVDISFSGFSSQGDGASFTCNYAIVENLLTFLGMDQVHRDVLIGWNIPNLAFLPVDKVRQLRRIQGAFTTRVHRISHHYSHENTVRVEVIADTLEKHKRINALLDYFEEFLEEFKSDICHAIYRHLEKEYDYLNSDESITANIKANEYEFTEDGRIA